MIRVRNLETCIDPLLSTAPSPLQCWRESKAPNVSIGRETQSPLSLLSLKKSAYSTPQRVSKLLNPQSQAWMKKVVSWRSSVVSEKKQSWRSSVRTKLAVVGRQSSVNSQQPTANRLQVSSSFVFFAIFCGYLKSWRSSVFGRRLAAYCQQPTDDFFVLRAWCFVLGFELETRDSRLAARSNRRSGQRLWF